MTLTASTVKVESGRILVRPSFAELLACSRVPGARWDTAAKAYALPVSAAALVAQSVRSLHKAAPLQNLLAADQTPQPTHVTPQAPRVATETAIATPVPEPEFVLPEGLRTSPWRHQVAAIRWATAKFAAGHRGLMLACGMGVGKTLISLALLLLLRAQRVLIAAPLRVLPVWLTQYERHVDAPAVVVALDEDAGSVAQRKELAAAKLKLAETMGVPFIVIVNYDSIWREPFASWAEKQRWDLVIGDECVPADTEIATPSGSVPIQSLIEGDTILGISADGRVVPARVTATFRRVSTRPFVKIDSLIATANHPVWVSGRGYVNAAEVRPGDAVRVYEDDHDYVRMVRLVLHEDGDPRLVFNIETSTGNYFANGILVHNCHRVKSPSGRASLFFKRLRKHAAYRLALTGTPMPHGPMDIYAQFRFLDITIFGPSFSAFRTKYAVMGGYHNKQITGFQKLDELEALMSRITFRVGSEVLDLPPATHVTYCCDLGPEARRVYRDLEKDFVAEVREGTVTAANALVKLTRLQQVANGVIKTDSGIEHRIDDAKRKLLADTLEDMARDEAVVVFCRYHLDLDAVHEACQAVGFDSLELSGRRDELARWQEGGGQVLAVQISAGGVGVDLTRARFSLYYSLGFSLGDYDQSLARIHRPGQTRPVEYIHLVARNTVDVKIMRALEKRAAIVEAILAELKH